MFKKINKRYIIAAILLLLFIGIMVALLGAKMYFDNQKEKRLQSYVTGFNLPPKAPNVKKTTQKFNSYSITRAEKGNIDSPITIEIGGGKVSFTTIENNILGGLNDSDASTSGKKITYKNIYNGINLIYTSSEDKILEEYEVRAKRKIEYFAQKIDIKGLKYEKKNDGSIIFTNSSTKQFAFAIPMPVMYERYNTRNKNFGIHYEIF